MQQDLDQNAQLDVYRLPSSIPFLGVYFVFTRRWLPRLRFFVRLALPTVTVD